MKRLRTNRSQKALRRLNVRPAIALDTKELDKQVFDLVLKTLYNNTDRNGLHVENEIFAPLEIKMPAHDTGRLWEVMISSGWVSPVIGFGNAGKLELTKAGYQLMSQFGGYSEYLTSVLTQQQPQTIILPIQIQGEEEETHEIQESPEANKVAQQLPKKKRKHK